MVLVSVSVLAVLVLIEYHLLVSGLCFKPSRPLGCDKEG
jgi:hypothetical protein